jgi:hypothetical protein
MTTNAQEKFKDNFNVALIISTLLPFFNKTSNKEFPINDKTNDL